MNWFKKHLNWSFLLSLVVYYFACFLMGFAIGLVAPETSDNAVEVAAYILFAVMILPASAIIIKAKGRSLWWVLLAGWLSPLWLSNKRHTNEEV